MKKRVLSMLLTSTLCAGVIPNTSTVFAVENISDNTTSAEKQLKIAILTIMLKMKMTATII